MWDTETYLSHFVDTTCLGPRRRTPPETQKYLLVDTPHTSTVGYSQSPPWWESTLRETQDPRVPYCTTVRPTRAWRYGRGSAYLALSTKPQPSKILFHFYPKKNFMFIHMVSMVFLGESIMVQKQTINCPDLDVESFLQESHFGTSHTRPETLSTWTTPVYVHE